VESEGPAGADRAPGAGRRSARIAPLAEPRCYGAAGRPGRRACLAPALARAPRPRPDDAYVMPDSPCRPLPGGRRYAVMRPCAFGDLDSPRRPAAALIGDSHARVLRAAVEVVAQARGWRAVSLTHPGCAFSTEVSASPDGIPAGCRIHSDEALAWLRRHPSVHVVITAALTGRGFGPAGFAAMWARVPRSVRRIYVIRDVPHMRLGTADCVTAVIRRHAPHPWRDCAVPRAAALPPDPAAEAAAAAPSRVRLIDLTRRFCDAARCYPVVGGVYAYKDTDHVNRWFATTLGPYLAGQLRLG
jgi:SGNH domain (fused to AT3 domains)